MYTTNKEVRIYNTNILRKISPVTVLKAVNRPSSARSLSIEALRGLQNELFLAVGAEISLTTNMHKTVGLNNRSLGTAIDIVYLPTQTPNSMPNSDLPHFVLVRFPMYIGPQFFTSEVGNNKGKLFFIFRFDYNYL